MKLFRIKKEKWAEVVMPESSVYEMNDQLLSCATDAYIQQHCRILYQNIRIISHAKDEEKRQSAYAIACKEYGALIRVRKFTDRKQKQIVNKAISDFVEADVQYHHSGSSDTEYIKRKNNREEFWSGVAQEEFFVDFMDDLFEKK